MPTAMSLRPPGFGACSDVQGVALGCRHGAAMRQSRRGGR